MSDFRPIDRHLEEDLALLRDIYPNATEDQVLEAKESLDRYLAVAIAIATRMTAEAQVDRPSQIRNDALKVDSHLDH